MSTSASSNKRSRLSDPSPVSTPGASTSSSSAQKKSFKYDVFISFRGEDTRKTFVGHLYQALKDKGIQTYKDDVKIEQGKTIDNQLIQAVKDSRFFIIVFSRNYASSSWCLDELVEIMGCQKTGEQTAYPVFFDVEPTEIRNQSRAVKEAFAKHEKNEAAGKWREAIKEASNLAGWELKAIANGHEAEFIKKIVGEISLELRSISFGFEENLVGMETRVKDVVSSLEFGADEVRIIGIKGMGGAGKTTTARAVFDNLSAGFEAKSFVENVREVSTTLGLKKLQEQVLSNVLKDDVTLDSVNDGKNMLKRRMCGIKVLLVLDDVDHIDQLEALAIARWFKPGSRILITTRDEQVLKAHGVKLIRDINLLSEREAICLFSRYAFGTENPVEGYKELSGKVVRYAAGLPLTIKVLGSFLCGKGMDDWEDAIERLKNIPLKETLEKLELSYKSLEGDYQQIFLDIACILKGKSKEYAIRILECCGFHARNGLKVLEQRSLITISIYGRLGMRDHIEEMGKNIVRRLHPDEPNKHSRLWINEEIEDILANDMGTEATRCLRFNMWRKNSKILMNGFGKMKKLRYLEVTYYFESHCDSNGECLGSDSESTSDCESDVACLGKIKKLKYLKLRVLGKIKQKTKRNDAGPGSDPKLDKATQYFPNSLKYIKFSNYPFLYLPKTLQSNNLVGLEMAPAKRIVQLWMKGEKKVLKNLKFLSLYKSKLTMFDFRIAPNLETLSLELSFSLAQLFMPASYQKLKHLNIRWSKLRTFDLGLAPNLETLSLENSEEFEDLQASVACPNLKILNLYKLRLRSLDLGLFPNLERLDLKECSDFVELQVSASCPNLKSLDLSGSRLRSLDLELIPNLETLHLKRCRYFVELQVSALCPNLKILTIYQSRLRSLDLELIPNLETLHLLECHKLVEINAPVGCLKRVGNLNLHDCLRFSSFCFIGQSEPKGNCSLATLDLFGESLDSCPLHPNSNLPKLQFHCYYEEYLPSSVGNIERLISFGLCACTDFKKISDIICSLQCLQKLKLDFRNIPEFPKDLGKLECLEELCLVSDKVQYLPDSICMLKRLKSLKVVDSDLLEKLPEDLGQLDSLEKLYVSSKKIECLPDGICTLKRLKYLLLHFCALLEKLPEDLGRLGCLGYLDITDTGITHLPQSIFGLKGLKIAASSELLQLYDFPSEIKTTTTGPRWWYY